MVSPFWDARASSVGHAETIDHIDREDVRLVSDKKASNYKVNVLAIGTIAR